MTERALNWLTPRVYTVRFQKWHLIINYSLLALACIFYLIGLVGIWVISLACLPGMACFLLSFECMAWKLSNEGDIQMLIQNMMGNFR